MYTDRAAGATHSCRVLGLPLDQACQQPLMAGHHEPRKLGPMTASRLMKSLFLVSFAAAVAAFFSWQHQGATPAPWLLQTALATFAVGLLTGLIGSETRPRLMLRFLAALFMSLAVIAFAADLAMPRPSGQTGAFTVAQHMSNLFPKLLEALQLTVSRTFGPLAWDPMMTMLLGLPAYAFFLLLALLTGYAGRPRHPVQIFVN